LASRALGEQANANVQVRHPTLNQELSRAPAFREIPDLRLVDPNPRQQHVPLHELYTRAVERGSRKEAKDIIRELVPNLEDIEILTQQNQPVLYLVFDDGAHPVQLAGEGIQLLLRLSFELATSPGGVVLLEEPETHLHPAGIRQSARAMLAAMRRGVQVIMTTHSLDLIDALLATAKNGDLDQISVYRVQLEHGELKTHRMSGREAAAARTEIEEDLR